MSDGTIILLAIIALIGLVAILNALVRIAEAKYEAGQEVPHEH